MQNGRGEEALELDGERTSHSDTVVVLDQPSSGSLQRRIVSQDVPP